MSGTCAPAGVLPSLPPPVLQLVLCLTGQPEALRISKSTSCSTWTPECMAAWLTACFHDALLHYQKDSMALPQQDESSLRVSSTASADSIGQPEPNSSGSSSPGHFRVVVKLAARVEASRHAADIRQYICHLFPYIIDNMEAWLQHNPHEAQQQLNHAARTGDYLTCHYLLHQKFAFADVNDSAALILAADHGHVQVLRLLLQQPIRAADAAAQGSTALSLAALKGHMAACKLLLLHGAQANSWLCLALQWAAIYGDVEVVQLLLGASENRAKADARGGQPLIEAAKHGHVGVIELLLRHEPHASICESQALVVAAEAGHTQVCKLLLQQPVKPAMANAQGGNALLVAAKQGHADICQLLLCATPPPPLHAQHAALQSAVELGHTDIECVLRLHLQLHEQQQPRQLSSASSGWYESEYLPLWVLP